MSGPDGRIPPSLLLLLLLAVGAAALWYFADAVVERVAPPAVRVAEREAADVVLEGRSEARKVGPAPEGPSSSAGADRPSEAGRLDATIEAVRERIPPPEGTNWTAIVSALRFLRDMPGGEAALIDLVFRRPSPLTDHEGRYVRWALERGIASEASASIYKRKRPAARAALADHLLDALRGALDGPTHPDVDRVLFALRCVAALEDPDGFEVTPDVEPLLIEAAEPFLYAPHAVKTRSLVLEAMGWALRSPTWVEEHTLRLLTCLSCEELSSLTMKLVHGRMRRAFDDAAARAPRSTIEKLEGCGTSLLLELALVARVAQAEEPEALLAELQDLAAEPTRLHTGALCRVLRALLDRFGGELVPRLPAILRVRAGSVEHLTVRRLGPLLTVHVEDRYRSRPLDTLFQALESGDVVWDAGMRALVPAPK